MNVPLDIDEERALLALVARSRAETYGLLANVLSDAPTVQMLDSLRQPEALSAFEALGINFAAQLDQMESDLGKDGLVEELECEYTRLFLGPGKHVGPYESLHRDDNPRQHWGPSTAEVKRFIEHHGLSYEEGFQGMPDHISVELQFISVIAAEEANAIERGDNETMDQAREIQQVFLREHILRWVPAFCDKVFELAELDFYKFFVSMTKALVEVDNVDPLNCKPS